MRGVLSDDDRALLERGVEEIFAAPGGMASRMEGADGRGGTVLDQLPSLALHAFLARGIAAEIAARVMEVPSAHFVLDQLFYKEAGRVLPTPWHQDTPFLRVRGDDMARVWLTCDPSPRELTVQLVRGSHRWNVVYDTMPGGMSELVTVAEGDAFSYEGIGDSALPRAPDVARFATASTSCRGTSRPAMRSCSMATCSTARRGSTITRCRVAPMPRCGAVRICAITSRRRRRRRPSIAERSGHAVPHGARIGDYPEAFPAGWRH